LRATTAPFVPGSIAEQKQPLAKGQSLTPDTETTKKAEPAKPQSRASTEKPLASDSPTRRISGENKKLSIKESLLEKVLKRKRELERRIASKKAGKDDTKDKSI
jgi:hypothetical protein